MEFLAKVIFDQRVLKDEVGSLYYDELSKLESGDNAYVYLNGVHIHGEGKYTTLEDGEVHRMYIYMHNMHEDLPSFLQGKEHRVEVAPMEFTKSFGINLRVHSSHGTNGGFLETEAIISADEWYKTRPVLALLDQFNKMSFCENCGRPLVDPTGKLIADPRTTRCFGHCKNSNQLVLEELEEAAVS